MVVHNVAEYVAFHQEKLRQQSRAQSQSQRPVKRGVNTVSSVSSFNTQIKAENKVVVVDFFATWCGPCKQIAPMIAKWSNEDEFSNVEFIKVDVDEVPDVAQEQGIRAMPTFKIFKNGEEVDEVVGADPNKLQQKIRALL